MWSFEKTIIEQGNIVEYSILENGKRISFEAYIDLIIHSFSFRTFFNEVLSKNEFQAFFFEVKPVTLEKLNADFEFAVVNSLSLAKINSDKSAFQEYLSVGDSVVTFHNLNKDAQLVVPNEISEKQAYAHIANFVRRAEPKQIDTFWQLVGKVYKASIKNRPIWLSTSGLGVYWLHMRIDAIPKYYSYAKYKKAF